MLCFPQSVLSILAQNLKTMVIGAWKFFGLLKYENELLFGINLSTWCSLFLHHTHCCGCIDIEKAYKSYILT